MGRNLSEIDYWFVGAYDNDQKVDLSDEFIEKGVWVNLFQDKLIDTVNSMKVGDKIAIKSTYVQSKELPFENNGHSASVMAIKAIGEIVENDLDGHTLRVRWIRLDPIKKWYFWTFRQTIWKLNLEQEYSRALVDFTFNDVPQDLETFCNDPYWSSRFGKSKNTQGNFEWTRFYAEIANAIRKFRSNRQALIHLIQETHEVVPALTIPTEKIDDDSLKTIIDICPFTFFGLFNKGLTDANRVSIAAEFAKRLEVSAPTPEAFDGIPVLSNFNAMFFPYAIDRDPDDIEKLWELFEAGLDFADEISTDSSEFENAFDQAKEVKQAKWNLTMALYWARPWSFVPLDTNSREYIRKKLKFEISFDGPNGMLDGKAYVDLMLKLNSNFEDVSYPVHSFPELSYQAWLGGEDGPATNDEKYALVNLVEDGCFIPASELESILERFKEKKNLILQGPPGTGKTWLAKRLAYALIGERSQDRVAAMQFHSNFSYEDFVRGWRPSANATLQLEDGPFIKLIDKALAQPDKKFVFVIEEINRGNPAQIFGELLTLLESDKRTPAEGLQLTYKRDENERIYIPENLYVIGTMNLADRSLALMDFAFRRRFAFKTLEPMFNENWERWIATNGNIPTKTAKKIQAAVIDLNEEIASDENLGSSFRIGHSFFTPKSVVSQPQSWVEQILETELRPLLYEYWFDNHAKADESLSKFRKYFD